ncbi:MAG: hypothetical protein CL862_00195 [Cyanobium sp. NAT70]|nr:hypothetical protein [Cyanobium sp. NAT70]|tara:strand:- start:539 stop:775 length:237 start_codon:yes stop_codon:yes gene_type:complete
MIVTIITNYLSTILIEDPRVTAFEREKRARQDNLAKRNDLKQKHEPITKYSNGLMSILINMNDNDIKNHQRADKGNNR